MGERRIRISVIIISIIVVLSSMAAVVSLNLDKVQDFYEGLIDNPDDENGDSNDIANPDSSPTNPVGGKSPSLALSTLLSSSSNRKIDSMTTVVSSGSEFFPLIATPISTDYHGSKINLKPLLVEGASASKFLEIDNSSALITLGNVDGINGDYNFRGDEKSASLEAANTIWSQSRGALIIEQSREGYEIGLTVTSLAAYLNIPVIITKTMDDAVKSTLSNLGVRYTLICGNVGSYRESFYFSSVDEAYELTLEFLSARFGSLSYITLVNSQDVRSDYGISHISSLAPYLSSSRGGLVINCPEERLESMIFEESEEKVASLANDLNSKIKEDLQTLLFKMDVKGLYWDYINTNPYLALLGDPYSIPFYYFENPNPSTSSGADDAWVATDDFYADLDDDLTFIELAAGRVLALSLGGTCALISRSLCYSTYMQGWAATSRMNDAKDCEWKDTAYAAKGDDWNGAMYAMTRDYWEEVNYLQNQGYSVHTTQRRATGSTVSQDIMEYYSSSSMIYVIAHGSDDSYQNFDSVTASEVKNWEMGPSVQLLTSCSAARIDVPNIHNTISLAFIETGVNSYIGGSRTESSADSPTLTGNAIQGMVSNDETVGIACRNAKNMFMGSDSNHEHASMRVLYGEPAFNPYQP